MLFIQAHAHVTPCIACEKARVNYSSFTRPDVKYQTFLPYFFGPRLEYMFEENLKLSLSMAKRFNAFEVLKWFLIVLEATCVIFARATNTDM